MHAGAHARAVEHMLYARHTEGIGWQLREDGHGTPLAGNTSANNTIHRQKRFYSIRLRGYQQKAERC